MTNDPLEQVTRFWSEFGWARTEGDGRNTDQIPGTFDVDFPCPECGSVWVELDAFGFIAPRAPGNLVYCFDEPLIGFERPTGLLAPRAIRLVCAAGHRLAWDVPTGNKRIVPALTGAMLLGMGAIVAAYVLPILASTRKS